MGKTKAKAKTKVDKRQDKQIKKIIQEYQPEMKTTFICYPSGTTANAMAPSSNTPLTLAVVPVGEGDGNNQRTGTLIRIKKVVINCVAGTFFDVSAYNWLRFVLVQDKGYAGTAQSYQNLLDGTSVADGRDDNFYANYDINYVNMMGSKNKPLKVLMDKRMVFGKIDTTAGSSFAVQPVKHEFRFKKVWKSGLPVKFDGSSGGDVRANNLILYVFPGNDTTSTSNPSWSVRCQVYYTDV